MQALGIAWDARPEDQGGQRWFHLYPDQKLEAGDPLHWTGIDQTWNFMCAECHSTELRKNYDAAANTYATTWAEIDVACEACHGPGSAHVAWAERQQSWLPWGKGGDDGLTVHFDERAGVHWTIDPATGNAARSAPRTGATELETCGICHSRSARIAEGWRPGQQLLETHVPALLQPGLFEADGKMVDEVYNYASFRQSKMFMQGVTCSDCHEPHSLQLRAEGNGVCYQCHEQAKYGAVSRITTMRRARRRRAARPATCRSAPTWWSTRATITAFASRGRICPRASASPTAATTATPTRTRPGRRPRSSAGTGRSARAFRPGPRRLPRPGTTLRRPGRCCCSSRPRRARRRSCAPPRSRTSPRYPSREAVGAAQQGLADADPLVRLAALRTLRWLPVEQSWQLAQGLLDDPVRGVRLEAASLLAAMPQDQLAPADRERLSRARRRLRGGAAAQRRPARGPGQSGQSLRPAGAVGRGRGRVSGRPRARSRVSCRPTSCSRSSTPGRAAMPRASGLCAKRSRACPRSAELHMALGLNLVRQGRAAEALPEFARAAELDPGNARYAYVHGVALNSTGRTDEALEVLEASQARHPADRDTLLALVTINRDAGRFAAALTWADRLVAARSAGAHAARRDRAAGWRAAMRKHPARCGTGPLTSPTSPLLFPSSERLV